MVNDRREFPKKEIPRIHQVEARSNCTCFSITLAAAIPGQCLLKDLSKGQKLKVPKQMYRRKMGCRGQRP